MYCMYGECTHITATQHCTTVDVPCTVALPSYCTTDTVSITSVSQNMVRHIQPSGFPWGQAFFFLQSSFWCFIVRGGKWGDYRMGGDGITELRFLETTAHWSTVIHDCVDGCQGGCQISVFAIRALQTFCVCLILWSPLQFATISLSLPFSPLLTPSFLYIFFLFLIWLPLCAEHLHLTFIMPYIIFGFVMPVCLCSDSIFCYGA